MIQPLSGARDALRGAVRLAGLAALGLASLTLGSCGGGGGDDSLLPVKGTVPRFAYTVSFIDPNAAGVVSGYTVDVASGRLRHNGLAPAGKGPAALSVDPTDRFVYVANQFSDDVSAFRIRATTGTLTAIGSPVAAGDAPVAILAEPSGRFVYAANRGGDSVSAYGINDSTGALTAIGVATAAGDAPAAIATDPDGEFAFVANENSDSISVYAIGGNGALTPVDANPGVAGIQQFSAGDAPVAIAVDPTGKAAYVVSQADTSVSAYSINAGSGALTSLGGALPTGATPLSAAVDPAGKFLFIANNGGDLSAFRIDAGTGALSVIACGGGAGCNGDRFQTVLGARAVTVDTSGAHLYVAQQGANESFVATHRIDAVSGVLTAAGTTAGRGGRGVAIAAGTTAVTYEPTFAYVANQTSSTIDVLRIDATTGALTVMSTLMGSGLGQPAAVAIDPSGRFAYVGNQSPSSVTGYTINAGTGALTLVAGTGTVDPDEAGGTFPLPPVSAVVVDPSGRFAYVSTPGISVLHAFGINATSGALSPVLCTGAPDCGSGVVGNRLNLSQGIGVRPINLAFDPAGRFLLTGDSTPAPGITAVSIDPVTGAHASAGRSGPAAVPLDLAFSPNAPFAYVPSNSAGGLIACRVSAFGSANCAAAVAAGEAPNRVAVDPYGRFAYVANFTSDDISAYVIDSVSGVPTEIACVAPATCNGSRFAAADMARSLAVDASGRFLFATGTVSTATFGINAASGALTFIDSVPVAGTFITTTGQVQ